MYCPICGAESTQGLNYCKRCGGNLTAPMSSRGEAIPPAKAAGGVVWLVALATVAVTLGGLGIVFSHAFDLVRPSFPGTSPIAGAATIAGLMIAFGSATVFGTVALLIQLFSRLLGVTEPSRRLFGSDKRPVTGEFKPAQIPAAPPMGSSVTEGTTRNFDPALYRDHER